MRAGRILITLATVAILTPIAWANPITPVFFIRGVHLLLGNAIIGILEGLLIALIWKSPKFKAMGLMILANYFSMIVGRAILSIIPDFGIFQPNQETIYNFQNLPYILVPILWLAAVLLEWPFCTWSVKKGPSRWNRWKKGLLASLAAQTVSYALLVVFYYSISTTPQSLGLDVTPAVVTENKDPAWLYFLRDDGLYRIRLNGSEEQKLQAMTILDKWDAEVWAAPNQASNTWDLYLRTRGKEPKKIIENFAARPSILSDPFQEWWGWEPEYWRIKHSYYRNCYELRSQEERDWRIFRFGNYFSFSAHNEKTGQNVDLVVDTPFTIWQARESAVALPGDKAVTELGGRIILIDLNGRRVGQITTGFSPVVVWEGPMKDSWTPKDFATTQPAGKPSPETSPNK